jgi:monofunctional biosynthetic peptidoglycan transglycosylase
MKTDRGFPICPWKRRRAADNPTRSDLSQSATKSASELQSARWANCLKRLVHLKNHSSATHRFLMPTAFALLFVMNTHAAVKKTLFDFQNATNVTVWQVVNDGVMGGVSASSFRITNGVAVFQGKVSLENNGGFASVRSLPARHDLGGADAFVVRVRGDGRRYKFTARMDDSFDSAIYRCDFATKNGVWEEHRLPLKDFVASFRGRVLTDVPPLNPAKVSSVGFLISDQQAGPFQLEVAWIKASPPPGK